MSNFIIEGTTSTSNLTSTSMVVTLSTTSTNDIIILDVAYGWAGQSGKVSTVTDTSLLSWTSKSLVSSGANGANAERWWAYSATALTLDAITIHFNSDIDQAEVIAYGVHCTGSPFTSSSPWDTNVNASKTLSGTSSTLTISGVSTNATNVLVLQNCCCNGGDSEPTPGSGFAIVSYLYNGSGSNQSFDCVQDQGFTSAQAGLSCIFTNMLSAWASAVDVLAQPGSSSSGSTVAVYYLTLVGVGA